MSSPAKEELPKIATDIKSELEAEHKLAPVETVEKVVLPSAEDITTEKTHNELVKGIETFDAEKSLTPTETVEKNALPTQEVIEAEKAAEVVAE